MPFNPITIITHKRDGRKLSTKEIEDLVDGYTRGDIPDYQMSAFLMAGLLRGFDNDETMALTRAMFESGTTLELSPTSATKVDKHSTGGVGDKVSLILAPLVAACGIMVPMISGRGLGHSGGTLDKLESIPGFLTDLTLDNARDQLERINVVMMGQTDEIAPADRKIYALRDVTGTIDFIPYIVASILSKKLAEGVDALVMDVKTGKGAFMRDENRARHLAESLVHTGEAFGVKTTAWVTRMDEPLGYSIGNWPEVAEAVRCLRGDMPPDIAEIVSTLAGEMLFQAKVVDNPGKGRAHALHVLRSGTAFEKFVELVKEQGGDVSVLYHPEKRTDAKPAAEIYVPAYGRGFIASLDALTLGRLSVTLGAGRRTKEDVVDPNAGILIYKKVGDAVEPGDLLARLYTNKRSLIDDFVSTFHTACLYSEHPPEQKSVLIDRYEKGRWMTGHQAETMPPIIL